MDPRKMSSEIRRDLGQFRGKKILIFGDVGIDEYVMGEVYRISPEAPVPIVDVRRVEKKLGLAANVAANISSLGGDPLLVSVVGNDKEGEGLQSLLTEKSISANYLVTEQQRSTTAKTRVMSGQHHIVRVDYENRHPISETTLTALQNVIAEILDECAGVIIQDYAKGVVSTTSSSMVIKMAKAAGKFVIVDPYRSTALETYRGADFMTPNQDEAMELARQIPGLKDWQEINKVGPALMAHIGAPQMVITLGAQGMKIFGREGIHHIPTFARKVFDVTGAGDTVIAAFALGRAAGWSLEKAGYFANLAAGVVVGQVGAVACTIDDLLAAIDAQE